MKLLSTLILILALAGCATMPQPEIKTPKDVIAQIAGDTESLTDAAYLTYRDGGLTKDQVAKIQEEARRIKADLELATDMLEIGDTVTSKEYQSKARSGILLIKRLMKGDEDGR